MCNRNFGCPIYYYLWFKKWIADLTLRCAANYRPCTAIGSLSIDDFWRNRRLDRYSKQEFEKLRIRMSKRERAYSVIQLRRIEDWKSEGIGKWYKCVCIFFHKLKVLAKLVNIVLWNNVFSNLGYWIGMIKI